ncbi:DUF2283 domain-containing protein [Actinobaculum sp. 313]|nr:DUF2283 domain-containing protein [Actinobaculum sp. 313]
MTYDSVADAADIELVDISRIYASRNEIHHPDGINEWEINLHFDVKGCLVGVEILFAKEGLPAEFVAQCQQLA